MRPVRLVLFESPTSTATPVVATMAREVQFTDVYNGVGSGSFTAEFPIPVEGSDLTAYNLAAGGHLARVDIYVEEDETYVPAGLFRIEGRNRKYLAKNETLVIKSAGRGVASDFERSVVYPYGGAGRIPWNSERLFNWAAPELDTDLWSAADIRDIQGLRASIGGGIGNGEPPFGLNGFPYTWPNPLSYWLWGQPPTLGLYAPGVYGDPAGICYFQYKFSTDIELDVTFHVTADDLFVAALDAAPIIDFSQREGDVTIAADGTRYRKLRIPPGDHTFAAKVENLTRPGMNTNGGLLNVAATYTINPFAATSPWGALESFAFLFTTVGVNINSPQHATQIHGWRALAYPTAPPGIPGGRIIDILVGEAQARGELVGWSVVDTTTDQIPDFSVPVGSTIMEVLDRMVADGWIDWWVEPDALVLHVAPYGTKGSTVGATYTQGVSLFAAEDDERWNTARSRLLVGWSNGFTEVGAGAGAPAGMGPSTGFLSIGDGVDLAEVQRRSNANLAKLDDDSTGVSATIYAIDADHTPWNAWGTGGSPSIVLVDPLDGELGDPVNLVCVELGVTEQGQNGAAQFSTQFLSRRRFADELASKLAARAVPGALGGRTDSVVPAAPNQPQGALLEVVEFHFNLPGRAADADTAAVDAGFTQQSSGFERTTRRVRLQRATLEASDDPTGVSVVDVYINGYWSITLVLDNVIDEVYDFFGSPTVWADNLTANWFLEIGPEDTVQARLRNDPGQHRNLTLRLFGSPIP